LHHIPSTLHDTLLEDDMRTFAALGSIVVAGALLAGCSLVTGKPAGQIANDLTMTTTVKSRLARTEGVGTLTGISVRTHNDMVYLRGTVADQATMDRVDALVRNIAGHNRVTNELQVAGQTTEARRP
jgi:osmotically-inducible protein OsmY